MEYVKSYFVKILLFTHFVKISNRLILLIFKLFIIVLYYSKYIIENV
jgi:hypothetical protein